MRQEIELYLGGQSVEFSEPPEILFSYIRTDYTDPTVLRNSYSKTLNIEGTPNNNQIFNSIYHLDKISDYGTFNPAKRMEFQLFSNGDILEQGYAKLDRVNKNGKNISYDITLYGGLGEFLYNLSYDQTAEGSDTSRGGGEGRRLSSLVFYDETAPDQEFDFEITKETVAEAWDALGKGTGATKWQYINFAPAYNGYPEDFDADKVLINVQNSSCPVTYNNNGVTGSTSGSGGGFPSSIKEGDTTYRAYNNYALGELPKEMTEWEMRDLRSYLQRPIMSMKGFINAISRPVNNGGYSIDLDPAFFNSDNPYYEKAWVTLPLLKKDEVEAGQSAKTQAETNVLSFGSSMGDSYDKRYYLQGIQGGATYNSVEVNLRLGITAADMPDELMTSIADYQWFSGNVAYYSSIFVQLVGVDDNDNPVAASNIYNLTSLYAAPDYTPVGLPFGLGKTLPQTQYCTMSFFGDAYTPAMRTNETVVKGRFVKTSGNNYVWKNYDGNVDTISVRFNNKVECSQVYLRVTKVMKWRDLSTGYPTNFSRMEAVTFAQYIEPENARRNILGGWQETTATPSYYIKATSAETNTSLVGSQVKYTVTSDVVRSGDHISKGDLLNFDGTPCDYLLSYCKLFNLYISKDIYEKKIYIRTRDTFYNGGVIDLDQFIDRSKEIKVNPLAMESRWYDFAYPEDEKGGAATDYDNNYGVEYGKNKVQTLYEFDSAAKNLFEGNIYQNAVQVQESSKYYTMRMVRHNAATKTVPTFLYNAIDYKLFGSTPSDTLSSCSILPPSNYIQRGYTSNDSKEDWLPKLQLNKDNDPLEGTNILCFFGGFMTSPKTSVGGSNQQAFYFLTDDVPEMFLINGETPCWLWTKTEYNSGTKIAKAMTRLPVFSRMLYDENKIDYTWDFGKVRSTYVPVKAYQDNSTIFERWWSNYISDLYDANTRVVEAYVKMEGKVVGDWLRAMYWWDNCYWVLTEINDYNITSYATTRCKFVKVNDIANYTSGITPPQPEAPTAFLIPDKYMIDATGETIVARVVTSDGGAWRLAHSDYVHSSQSAGTGDTTITIEFDSNPNPNGRGIYIYTIRRSSAIYTEFWQGGTNDIQKEISATGNRLVFNYEEQTNNTVTLNYKNRGEDTVTITSSVGWVSGSVVSWNGDSAALNIAVDEHSGDTVRSATLTISGTSFSGSTTITIDQLPEYITIPNDGGTENATLSNDFEVTALTSYWAAIETTGNTASFTADANASQSPRQQTVKFTVDGDGFVTSATTELMQAGGGGQLIASPTAITIEYTGGDKIMTVNSTLPWSATSSPDWVTLSQSTGSSGQSTVIITFSENSGTTDRTGAITITDGTRTATVALTQYKKENIDVLTVSPTNLYFDVSGNTNYITVISPRNDWNIMVKPDWIVFSQMSGSTGYSMVMVTAAENTGSVTRTGQAIFSDGTRGIALTVSQPASSTTKTITLSPSIINVENSGGTPILHITYDNRGGDDVNITSSESWVHPTYAQWTGDTGNIVLNVDSYGVNLERQATITVTSVLDPTLSSTVTVKQKALPTISLNPVFLNFEQSGGTGTITLNSNTDWIIDIDNA